MIALLWIGAGMIATGAILMGTRRYRPAARQAWWLVAAASLLLAATRAAHALDPASAAAAPLVLLCYPAIAAAVAAVHRQKAPRDSPAAMDGLVITVAAALLLWTLVLEPVLVEQTVQGTRAMVTVGGVLGSLLLLAVTARLWWATSGSRDRTVWLLCAGIACALLSDWLALTLAARQEPHGAAAEAGWFAFLALSATAALTPAVAKQISANRTASPATAWRFVVLLGLVCLLPPLLAADWGEPHNLQRPAVVTGGSVLLFVLALSRMSSLLRTLRRTLRRERALRNATTNLVSAASRAEVRHSAIRAAVELLNQPGARSWLVEGVPGDMRVRAVNEDGQETLIPAGDVGLDAGMRRTDVGPSAAAVAIRQGPTPLHAVLGVPSGHVVVMLCSPVRASTKEAALIAVPRRPSAHTAAALEALAATVALAVDRLDVGELMVERRSERRLRLMLQYASDVICIVDHDLTVVYVTPAVEPIIGAPAPELLGMSWVDVVVPADRTAACDLIRLARSGRPARGGLRIRTADGNVRHVDTVVTEVRDDDLTGYVVSWHDVTERHELEEQLSHQAFHDALTGLANRALFRDRLAHAMARSRGQSADYAVLFVDLDDFKTVNDSLGHAAGDALLQEITERLRGCLRAGDTAARLGGDEFAVLLEGIRGESECVLVAERVLAAMRAGVDLGGTEVMTGASIGIALGYPAATVEELMRNADLALYDAKNAGRSKYTIFAPDMHEAAVARFSLTSELRHAIERGEMVVHYQPLLDLLTGEVVGLEALVRWDHPERGLLAPGEFVPLAEETGLIVPLGRAVLREAVSAVARWQGRYGRHEHLRIAVNVSGRQLQDPHFVSDVSRALEDSQLSPSTLVLEITETVLLPGEGVTTQRLHQLAGLGVNIYIDDFGTGYSSLSYLQQLPVNGLKLAQEFVATLPGSETESGLVRTIRDLAETLGLTTVVAEGIERAEQWTALTALGYSVGQGFHFSRPVPAGEVDELLGGRRQVAAAPVPGTAFRAAR